MLTVRDLDATRVFYTRLGMEEVATFTALHFGEHKINVHVAGTGGTIVANQPTPGSADLCFITTTPSPGGKRETWRVRPARQGP